MEGTPNTQDVPADVLSGAGLLGLMMNPAHLPPLADVQRSKRGRPKGCASTRARSECIRTSTHCILLSIYEQHASLHTHYGPETGLCMHAPFRASGSKNKPKPQTQGEGAGEQKPAKKKQKSGQASGAAPAGPQGAGAAGAGPVLPDLGQPQSAGKNWVPPGPSFPN